MVGQRTRSAARAADDAKAQPIRRSLFPCIPAALPPVFLDFLIDTAAIRIRRNRLKTNDGEQF
jgi:hypothetical protein